MKTALSSSCVGQICLGTGFALEHGGSAWHRLEKTDFPFASGYQLQLTFWLVFGPLVHFAVSISENERTLPGRGGTERGEHLSLLCTSPAFLSQVGRLRPWHNCTFWDTPSHPVWSGGPAGCPIHSLPLAPLEKTFLFLEVQLAWESLSPGGIPSSNPSPHPSSRGWGSLPEVIQLRRCTPQIQLFRDCNLAVLGLCYLASGFEITGLLGA